MMGGYKMDKRLVMVLVFVILGLAIFTYGYTQQSQYTIQDNTIQNNTAQNTTQNSTVQNSNEKTNVNGTAKYNDVVITQKGPNIPQKRGISVPVHYTVTNNGKNTIYNAEVGAKFLKKIKILVL